MISLLSDDWRKTSFPTSNDHTPTVVLASAKSPKESQSAPTKSREWLDDLCAVESDPCFFAGMGEIAAVRNAREWLEGGIG